MSEEEKMLYASKLKESGTLTLVESGREARSYFQSRKVIKVSVPALDEVLEGGLEAGNFYLFLGAAKSGKTTMLRSIAFSMAKAGTPIVYVNFEQIGPNSYAKIYNLLHGSKFQDDIETQPEEAARRIEMIESRLQTPGVSKLGHIPFYIAFWPKDIEYPAFNATIKPKLKEMIDFLRLLYPDTDPVLVLENLSDIYNERLNASDNLVNIVTQTAQDIKRFAMTEGVPILLAHHTNKLQGNEPTLDDVRDSKRVVDLAHSIFASYVETYVDKLGFDQYKRVFKYIAGRGMSDPKKWDVTLDGATAVLDPYSPPPAQTKKVNFKSKS